MSTEQALARSTQHAPTPSNTTTVSTISKELCGTTQTEHDIVGFEDENDPASPRNWSKSFKWLLVLLMSGTSLAVNITILVYAPATPQILAEFGVTNDVYSTLILCVYSLGSALGCLLVGPLSEIFGRRPVYAVGNLFFVMMLVGQAQSTSIGMMVALRCLNGLANTSMALNPAIIGDMFDVNQRGTAQSLMSLMPLLGVVVGPIAGGWIAQERGWRWTFWFAACFVAGCAGLFVLVFRESYEAVILRHKAARLRHETGRSSLRSVYDDSVSMRDIVRKAVLRPFKVFLVPAFLVTSAVANLLSGYVFLLATSMTEVFVHTYYFDEGATGLSFLGLAVGMALGSVFCSVVLDRYTKRMQQRHGGSAQPEWRLPPLLIGVVLMPVGLLLYGWSAQYAVHWSVPIIGTALCGFASYTAQIPVTTYLVDAFGVYRGSAMGALAVSRNFVSAVLPLAAPALYGAMGTGLGNTVLAAVALAIAPVPLLMLRYGAALRKWSELDIWS